MTAPTPSGAPTDPVPRIPFWWTGERVALGSDDEDSDAAGSTKPEGEEDDQPPCEHPEPLQVSDCYGELVAQFCPDCDAQLLVDDDDDDDEPADDELADTGAKKPKKRKKGKKSQSSDKSDDPNSRLPWLAFNATAAGAGHLAIWSLAGDPMAGVTYIARMTISVPQIAAGAVTLGAAVFAWKTARLIGLHQLPGLLGMAARPVAALGAAAWGQGTAPLITDLMSLAHPWSTMLAPLLAVGPVAVACWWGLDRNVTKSLMPVRWVARIPLATVVLSSALYAPGALT